MAAGAGRPIGHDGFPIGPWTPELLAEAISNIDSNGSAVDLRAVQIWLQDNEKGVSTENIRWLARIFGCDEPEAVRQWQAALTAAHSRFVAERKQKRTRERPAGLGPNETPAKREGQGDSLKALSPAANAPTKKFSLARISDDFLSARNFPNILAFVIVGCVSLGVLAFVLDLHSVSYHPRPELEKQVGYFWAPNWTILNLLLLPLFLGVVVQILGFWTDRGRSEMSWAVDQRDVRRIWRAKVETFSVAFGVMFFLSFGIVFGLQWAGVHLSALLNGEAGQLMIDWNLVAVVRPEIVSVPESIIMSGLAFFYTASCTYLYYSGLILLVCLVQDFTKVAEGQGGTTHPEKVHRAATMISVAVFRCTVLGIVISTCIKLQASYLMSDATNILAWLGDDLRDLLLGAPEGRSALGQKSLATFTSFLVLFTTGGLFFYAVPRLVGISAALRVGGLKPEEGGHPLPLWQMTGTVLLLAASHLLIGVFQGFSILLGAVLVLALYSLLNPMFGRNAVAR